MSSCVNHPAASVWRTHFVTNPEIFAKGSKEGIGNSIPIKLNQTGTVTETLRCIEMARIGWYKARLRVGWSYILTSLRLTSVKRSRGVRTAPALDRSRNDILRRLLAIKS